MLRPAQGNMYQFVTHTWNPIKGLCAHECPYCYMSAIRKRFNQEGKQPYLDKKELNADLGEGSFIFAGSSCDMFAGNIPQEWIFNVTAHTRRYNNKYLFQTKNPERFRYAVGFMPDNTVLCAAAETNRVYSSFMGNTPSPMERIVSPAAIDRGGIPIEKQLTIEPVLDFDLDRFISLIGLCQQTQINTGADSGKNNLPEPSKEKAAEFIRRLEEFTKVHKKQNLKRIVA